MGATAYGDPERFRGLSLFGFDPQGHIVSLVEPLTDKSLAMRRAVYRQTGEDIGWNHPESVQDPSQMQFDVAWLVQNELERAVVERVRQLVRTTGVKNLVVTGGVGLNCIMNKRLVDEGGIESIYVLPAPGDEGQSIGNALLFLFQHCRRADRGRFAIETPYLGREYSEAEMASALAAHAGRLEEQRLPLADLLDQAARYLAEGKIVCWFQGRSEFGPRALGNRSILADARRPEMKDVLNRRVKHREPFRPFSPSVLAEAALEYFDTDRSPFMNVAARVRPEKRDRIPAVVHKDGTARLQTVRERDNPRYHALIRRYQEITGIPVILNTSFNQQEPIVESPEDAVLTFLKMDVDCLVLGDHLVKKREG
jgi:carbamoyltransferase